VSDDPESPEGTVKGIVLNASDRTIAMWSWVEGYIAGATRIGRQTKQSRFDRLDHLNYKLIMVVVDGACKAEPSLNFEKLAGSILNRLLEEPDKYK
jgi:hypothetical protein